MSEDCPYCVFEKTEANCRGCFEGSHYRPKPITNADRIRAMTDEELANWYFSEFFPKAPYCNKPECFEDSPCEKCLLDWLKGEVRG